jgi:hypothetical protein
MAKGKDTGAILSFRRRFRGDNGLGDRYRGYSIFQGKVQGRQWLKRDRGYSIFKGKVQGRLWLRGQIQGLFYL